MDDLQKDDLHDFSVYGIPGSPYVRTVLMTLEEKGARHRLIAVAPGSLKTAEHLARHPFGRIPALQHGTFRLYETQAIVRYIDRVVPAPSLTPTNPQASGRMDQILNVNDWYLFQGVASVIGFQRIVGPRLMGLKTDEEAIAAAIPKAHTVFDELARQLGDGRFFVGESLSLADLVLAPQLDFLCDTPEWGRLTAQHENLRAWMDRMKSRPSMMSTTWERVARMAHAA
jgi:glutathione S-transferase